MGVCFFFLSRRDGGEYVPPTQEYNLFNRATVQTKYLYENRDFCDHREDVRVRDICFCQWRCTATALVFSVSVRKSQQNRMAALVPKKEKNRGVVAELCEQQSRLFSKYWRVLTEFSNAAPPLPYPTEEPAFTEKFSSYRRWCRERERVREEFSGF